MGSTAQSAAQLASGQASGPDGAASGAAPDLFKRLLMGSGPDSMNLAGVRSRAEEVKQSLDGIIAGLQINAAHIQWGAVVEKFAVVSVQLAALSDALRPLLKFYIAHPKAVNAANAPLLPIMLATRALPEMEEADAALLAAHEAAVGPMALGSQYEVLGSQIEHFNALVEGLTVHAPDKPGSGALDPKAPLRRELAAALHAAAAPLPTPRPPAGTSGSRTRAPELERLLATLQRGEGL